jgi:hypothetical protein
MVKRYADGGVAASSSPTDAFSQLRSQNNPTPPAAPMSAPIGAAAIQQSTNPQLTPPPANVGMLATPAPPTAMFRKGGKVTKKPVKKFAKGGTVSSASKRGDGCATKGKTRGTMR